MPPFIQSSSSCQMASAVPLRTNESEGIAIPVSSWRVARKVEWESFEDAHELEDALSANSSGSPRRSGLATVGSLPKRARIACQDRVGKLVIAGSVPHQGLSNLARSAPAPTVSIAASAQFSSSPFARLTLQPGPIGTAGASLGGDVLQEPAPSIDRTLVSGDGIEPVERELGYSSKSSDDGFRGGFRLDPDMESDAESSFWPMERMEGLKEGLKRSGNGAYRTQSALPVCSQSLVGGETKDVSVDERMDVIGRMSEAASEASFSPSVLYFAVLAMDLCLATMWRPLGHTNVRRTRGLGFTCLYLAAAQLGVTLPLERFCELAAVQESWVGIPVIRQQQEEVKSLLDVGERSGVGAGELWGKLVRATGKNSQAQYMAEFVSLLTGSDYSVDNFTMEMITSSSDILNASEDTGVESQAKVLSDALLAGPVPKARSGQKHSLDGSFVFGAVLPPLCSPSKPHCRAQAGPDSALKSGSQRLVKWR